ncbi:MAG: hypothetical protein AABW81_02415 [Nanoarchaeota archaeon]
MVKTFKLPEKGDVSSEYFRMRNEHLMDITKNILRNETIYFKNGFSILSVVVGDSKKEEFKAIINNTYQREIILLDENFYVTAEKLAKKYEGVTKWLRSTYGFLDRLNIPKEEWTIKF